MIYQEYKDVYDEQLAQGAIINDRMYGFKEDYLVLHCLLRKHNIKSCFEVGTHTGWGTKIIKNAIGDGEVYSLDLPDDEHNKSKQHPLSEGKKGVGFECDLPYTELRGDSLYFPFESFPCEAYWIDGEHTTENVEREVTQAMKCYAKLIILHDTDMYEVAVGLNAATVSFEGRNYQLHRVTDTRISYLLKKT